MTSAELGWPVFVKPARGGSSVGTSKARDAAELEQAIETAREHDPKVLVEAAIDGMEIECAVLEGTDGGAPEASVPGQVMVGGGADFYDFEAKYLADETSMVIPAPIPDPAIAEVRRLACAAFDAISCEGLARVDFFYTPGGRVLVNEINTMPGMTPASGFPKMWAATGLPLPQLMDRIIRTALAKRPGLRDSRREPGAPTARRSVTGPAEPGLVPGERPVCWARYHRGAPEPSGGLRRAVVPRATQRPQAARGGCWQPPRAAPRAGCLPEATSRR